MNPPIRITFTGIDERTDPDRVAELSKHYPCEWGVLYGGRLNGNRYSGHRKVYPLYRREVRLAAHLCGKFVQNALAYGPGYEVVREHFHRFQLNAREYNLPQIARWAAGHQLPTIVQWRQKSFPRPDPWLQFLVDSSGGRGVTITNIPGSNGALVGYAGGINPENVKQIVGLISEANEGRYWIDMESGVRTDDWLDLDKCEAVLKSVYGEST